MLQEIVFDINGKQIRLTAEEATALKADLDRLFGGPVCNYEYRCPRCNYVGDVDEDKIEEKRINRV